MDEYTVQYQEKSAKYQERLKACKTYDDLDALLKDMCQSGHTFRMKRSGYRPYDFHVSRYGAHRVTYLIDDGVSHGVSNVSNLHRSMKVW